MSDFLTKISNYSPKRLALLADQLQQRVESLEAARHAPIAIIGIGCRIPGRRRHAGAFLGVAARGVDAITEVPPDRWDIDAYYDPDPDAPGKMSTRWGGFLEQRRRFDPHFFGISPREAQRDGSAAASAARSRVGGARACRRERRIASPDRARASSSASSTQRLRADSSRTRDCDRFDAYTASGSAHSIASGRLSYLLGAHGPSVSVDTACSSSLVAIHLAVQSLRQRRIAIWRSPAA